MPAPAPEPTPEPVAVHQDIDMPPGLEPIDDNPPLFDVPTEPVMESVATERPLTAEDWDAVLAEARAESPISASMLGQTLFISDEDGVVYIGIHPDDMDTRDALLGESIGQLILEKARARCGRNVNLRVVSDASVAVPVPVEIIAPPKFEEVAPAPAPKPAPKPAPAPAAQEEKAAAPASLKPSEEEFYHDPLIEQALKTFHATLIKN